MLARLALFGLLLVPLQASAETPAAEARTLLTRYHEDLTAIDRARNLLEAAVERESEVDTIIMLSYVSFLWGDVRATTTEEKLAAYARGRELGRRAVELAPRNHDAHLWYAINTGRWGQTKGVLRSLSSRPSAKRSRFSCSSTRAPYAPTPWPATSPWRCRASSGATRKRRRSTSRRGSRSIRSSPCFGSTSLGCTLSPAATPRRAASSSR